MVRILNGIWNTEAQAFEIRINGHHFVKNHLKSRQKGLNFKWSGFWMDGAIAIARPFENLTIRYPTFKKSVIQIVGIQIPSVL